MKFYSELHELGIRYGTDKATKHVHKGLSMMNYYETYLKSRKAEKLNVLEIGILGGASLRAFRDYLGSSNIIGLDIDPKCKINNEK